MQAIPTPVKNVNLYPYLDVGPVGPAVQPVIVNATGTYSVGTLTTWAYYNLGLKGGEHKGKLVKGDKYIARAETEDGKFFETHWMYCMTTGEKPTFGASVNMIGGHAMMGSPAPKSDEEDPYIVLAELEDLNGYGELPPPAVGSFSFVTNGTGQLIATRVGTPHLMGIRIKSGLDMPLRVGEIATSISGRKVGDDQRVSYSNLKVVSTGDEPVLLQNWPR
jgi:hypothetical protein